MNKKFVYQVGNNKKVKVYSFFKTAGLKTNSAETLNFHVKGYLTHC